MARQFAAGLWFQSTHPRGCEQAERGIRVAGTPSILANLALRQQLTVAAQQSETKTQAFCNDCQDLDTRGRRQN